MSTATHTWHRRKWLSLAPFVIRRILRLEQRDKKPSCLLGSCSTTPPICIATACRRDPRCFWNSLQRETYRKQTFTSPKFISIVSGSILMKESPWFFKFWHISSGITATFFTGEIWLITFGWVKNNNDNDSGNCCPEINSFQISKKVVCSWLWALLVRQQNQQHTYNPKELIFISFSLLYRSEEIVHSGNIFRRFSLELRDYI